MLTNLIENRDNAMNEYYLYECTKNLGLYNRAVDVLSKYVDENNINFEGVINPMDNDYKNLTREFAPDDIDISDIDIYNLDFDIGYIE